MTDGPDGNKERTEHLASMAYQSALAWRTGEDQVMWAAFSAFCGTNAVLLVALFVTGDIPKPVPGLVISLAGLLVSIVWCRVQMRCLAIIGRCETLCGRVEGPDYLNLPPNLCLFRPVDAEGKALPPVRLRGRDVMHWFVIIAALAWGLALLWFLWKALF